MRFHQFEITFVLIVSSWVLYATAHASNPSEFPSNVWNQSVDVNSGVHYVVDRLEELANTITSTAGSIHQFRNSMTSLLSTVQNFQEDIQSKMEAEGHALEVLLEKLEIQFTDILEELQSEFSVPLPEDQDLRQKERAKFVHQALLKVENVVVNVVEELGMSGVDTRNSFRNLSPHIEQFLMVSGSLIDKHPELVELLIFSGITLLLPEGWFLRPLLRVFGFSSLAAWAQRFFFGAGVNEGSWFSILQAAGMKNSEYGVGRTIWGTISLGIGPLIWLKWVIRIPEVRIL
ncbi:hypothetical protein BU17DRAFT_66783 [Hysterangium stoloniferum]|nr:hypothetical protein BU17DRAFT_66783 [Hysterangium stoloniferum]